MSNEKTESRYKEGEVSVVTAERKAEIPESSEEKRERVQPSVEEGLDDRVEAARARAVARLQDEPEAQDVPLERFGAFANESRRGGRIVLAQEDAHTLEQASKRLRRQSPILPSLVRGIPIDVEYEGKTNNYSTQTKIISLPDGRKVFAVYSYAASSIHRLLDGVMKHLVGLRMGKVSRANWKEQFQKKSEIPIIESADTHTVLMPFLPNVNAYDLFVHNREIRDFEEVAWANEVDAEKKLRLVDVIIDELRRVHAKGKVWGEFTLPNIIFTKDEQVVVCDPEVEYDKGVSSLEARARDLKDIIHSVCSALAKAEGQQDFPSMVQQILERYNDQEVIEELKIVAAKKRTWIQKLTFGYEQVRTGSASQQEYEDVLKAIAEYSSEG